MVLHTAVGVYTMPGIQVNKALAQFSAYAEGLETAGLKLVAAVCADALHANELSAPTGLYDVVHCSRKTVYEPFMVDGWNESRSSKQGTYI